MTDSEELRLWRSSLSREMQQQQIDEFVPIRWDGKKVDIDRRNREKADLVYSSSNECPTCEDIDPEGMGARLTGTLCPDCEK
jgi:hypothetical protein